MKFKITEPKVFTFVRKHKVFFTTAVELVGFASTVYLACTEKTKAEQILEQEEAKKEAPLTVKEKVVVVAKTTWPACLIGLADAVLISYTNYKMGNKIEKLGTAAWLYSQRLADHKQAVVDKYGEKKASAINEAADKATADRVYSKNNVIDTGRGPTLFFEPFTGIFWRDDINYVNRQAVNFANKANGKNGIDLGTFLDMLDLPSKNSRIASHMIFFRDYDSTPLPSLKWPKYDPEVITLDTGEVATVLHWEYEPEYFDDTQMNYVDD